MEKVKSRPKMQATRPPKGLVKASHMPSGSILTQNSMISGSPILWPSWDWMGSTSCWLISMFWRSEPTPDQLCILLTLYLWQRDSDSLIESSQQDYYSRYLWSQFYKWRNRIKEVVADTTYSQPYNNSPLFFQIEAWFYLGIQTSLHGHELQGSHHQPSRKEEEADLSGPTMIIPFSLPVIG